MFAPVIFAISIEPRVEQLIHPTDCETAVFRFYPVVPSSYFPSSAPQAPEARKLFGDQAKVAIEASGTL